MAYKSPKVDVSTDLTGQVPLANGGTSANLTASNGGIFYSTATAGAILSGTATAGQIIRSGASTAPTWSTATYPATTTVSQILYSSATNVVGGITTANNSVVLTDGSGVPSLGTSLSNDFTFTKATSGATTTLTVSNTSNTASSAANILAQVAGGTAADATHQATISGGQNWTWGLDNSDSDAFVIASSSTLGTTNVMRVATTGEINFPLQSSFFAYKSSNSTNATGDGTIVGVVADTEIFDQNSDYDNGTGTYTAPITGRVLLGSILQIANIGASHTSGNMAFVTSNRTYDGCFISPAASKNASSQLGYSFTQLADMDAADTCTLQTVVTGSTKTITVIGSNAKTTFYGSILC